MAVQVGLFRRLGLQLRLPGVVHCREMAAKRAVYNYTLRDPQAREREGTASSTRTRAERVFHTYSCYDRGNDKLNLHYHYLDLVPKGRDEDGRGAVLGPPPRRVRSVSRHTRRR
jgi:predicted dithiol-disulfide oxidoreductase (DUF899 family)